MTGDLSKLFPSKSRTVPGAALRGFTLGSEHDVEADLAELRAYMTERARAIYARVSDAIAGTDPFLYPFSSKVRPTIAAIRQAHDAKIAAVRAGPEHQRLMRLVATADRGPERDRLRQAADELEAPVRAERDAALEAAAESLTQQLDAIAVSLEAKRDALRRKFVTNDHQRVALDLLATLKASTPADGIGQLVDLLAAVVGGQQDEATLAALLPMLNGLHATPGSDWYQNGELLEVVRAISWPETRTGLLDGGAAADVLDVSLNRVEKARGDLAAFLMVARDHATSSWFPWLTGERGGEDTIEARKGKTDDYFLFPEEEPPAPARSSQRPLSDYDTSFRRVSVTAERRAADAAARAEQGDDDEA